MGEQQLSESRDDGSRHDGSLATIRHWDPGAPSSPPRLEVQKSRAQGSGRTAPAGRRSEARLESEFESLCLLLFPVSLTCPRSFIPRWAHEIVLTPGCSHRALSNAHMACWCVRRFCKLEKCTARHFIFINNPTFLFRQYNIPTAGHHFTRRGPFARGILPRRVEAGGRWVKVMNGMLPR